MAPGLAIMNLMALFTTHALSPAQLHMLSIAAPLAACPWLLPLKGQGSLSAASPAAASTASLTAPPQIHLRTGIGSMPATTALPNTRALLVIPRPPAAWQISNLQGRPGLSQGQQPQAAALQLLQAISGSKAAWQMGILSTGPLVKMDMYQCTITQADSVRGLQLMAATHSLSYPHHSH